MFTRSKVEKDTRAFNDDGYLASQKSPEKLTSKTVEEKHPFGEWIFAPFVPCVVLMSVNLHAGLYAEKLSC